MLKGLSLPDSSWGWNSYSDRLFDQPSGLATQVRSYATSGPQAPGVVGFWVVWRRATEDFPAQRPQSVWDAFDAFSSLSIPSRAAYWSFLDTQIKRANDDGKLVMLTVAQSFPDWVAESRKGAYLSKITDPNPLSNANPADRAHSWYPDDAGTNGPWAWFINYLCARYCRVPTTPASGAFAGPHFPESGESSSVARGNPQGAYIDYLQPLNEPNWTWMPQANAPDSRGGDANPGDHTVLTCNVALMLQSAEAVARAYAAYGGPKILGPGTADEADGSNWHLGTQWGYFTSDVVSRLQNWAPQVPVGWSHHNYRDVKLGRYPGASWYRAEQVLTILANNNWLGGRQVWLTEGGRAYDVDQYQFSPQQPLWRPSDSSLASQQTAQTNAIRANFYAMRDLGPNQVRLWTQYLVNDVTTSSFQSGVRGLIKYPTWTDYGNPVGIASPPAPAAAMFSALNPTYGGPQP